LPLDTREIATSTPSAQDCADAPRDIQDIDEPGHGSIPSTLDAKQDTECDSPAEGSVTDRMRRVSWIRIIAYGVLPALALILALLAGYLKWADDSARDTQNAATLSVRAASEGTVALLSYKPDTVEQDLNAASSRLTGSFKDSYSALIRDVVIPGSRQKQITSVANVAAAASVSATENHAVVLVFVNQTITVGNDAPTNSSSSVQVTLDKVDGQWRIAVFEPV
jgi:Mce-associated membrane protein